MKKLTKQERVFCRMFALTGDGEYAARESGYRSPKEDFVHLCGRDEIAEGVAQSSRALGGMMRASAVAGLWRLAFGDVSDAVALCLDRDNPRAVRDADLFNIAEIKSLDRGVEIKFFDRIKAMEKLDEVLGQDAAAAPSGLIDALREGARALRSENSGL